MKYRRENWWRFGQPSTEMRAALGGLPFFFGTTATAAHRIFSSLDGSAAPDQKIRVIACSDWAIFGILCSRLHVEFSFRTGGWQGKGNDPVYQHTNTFIQFPFPPFGELEPSLVKKLRLASEELDQFRRAQIKANPGLTLTDMYNALEALRLAENTDASELSEKDRAVYQSANIAILKQHHDTLDEIAFTAYGWSDLLQALIGKQGATKPHQPKLQEQKDLEDELMYRLVALNKERAEEEARGHVRWLRPDYQNPAGHAARAKGIQSTMDIGPTESTAKTPWPKTLPEQIAAVRVTLSDLGTATPEQVARTFQRGRAGSVQPLLESLAALGQARTLDGGRFAA